MALRRANDTPFWQRSLEAQNPPDSDATHVLKHHTEGGVGGGRKACPIIAKDGL